MAGEALEDRIRVAIFLPNLEIGGAEILVLNLIDEFLKAKEFIFHLILLGHGGKLEVRALELESLGDFKFSKLGLPLEYGWKAASKLNQYLSLHGIQLIHSHLYVCDKICLILKLMRPSLKIISTKHSTIPLGLATTIANFLSQFLFTKTVFITPFQRKYYRKHYLMLCKTTLVENGSPMQKNLLSNTLSTSRGKTFRLICIGSFRPEKGQDILIEALNILGRSGIQFSCDFYGDGPELNKLRSQCDVKLEIRFHPAQLGIAEELGKYDLVVIPSRREGSSLILLESFLSRVPVLTSDYPVLAEKAGHGRRAILFKSEDPVDLASKIERFQMEPNHYYRMVEAAYRYALDFSISKTAIAYSRIYNEAAGTDELEKNQVNVKSRNISIHD